MQTFYIFRIKREYRELTKNDEYTLFKTIDSINHINKNNLDLAYNLLTNINIKFNKEVLSQNLYNNLKHLDGYTLFKNKHKYINYFTKEKSELIIKNNYLILISNKENNRFIKELKKIKNLFICNFSALDYYWVS